MQPQYFIPLIILVVGVIGYLSWRAEKQRREALQRWAQTRGYAFRSAVDRELGRRYPDFKILQRGRRRFAKNSVRGGFCDRPFTAFDYQYTTGHGKNRRTHRIGAVIVENAHWLLPLRIRRENVFDKIGEFLGFDDIDFESAEFSRKFHVSAPDRKWAFDVLHNRTIEFLLREAFANLELADRYVLVYRMRRFAPEEIERALALACGVLDGIPEYAVRELTPPPGVDARGKDG